MSGSPQRPKTKFYADTPARRTRQIIQDTIVALWILFWIASGMVVHDVIASLAGPAASIADRSASLAGSLDGIADQIDGVPVVGGARGAVRLRFSCR